jgi:glycine/D-amino acid oxidase-like deaminating enzyme
MQSVVRRLARRAAASALRRDRVPTTASHATSAATHNCSPDTRHRHASSTAPSCYDVVVVGGGVVGSSVAYHLKTADPSVKVCVIERDGTYARASTPLSAGSIRQQFSIKGNVELSLASMKFLRESGEHLKISPDDDSAPDIQLVEGGYLFLGTSAEGCATLRENHAVQVASGADILLMDRPALQARFPWLVADDVSLACFGQTGEGWFDPWALLRGFRRKALALGVDYLDAECTAVDVEKGVVRRVRTADGRELQCGTLVNAAGSWATELCKMAGIEHCPVRRRKRMIFVVRCPTGPVKDCPLVVDPSGVYFRREGSAGNFICGEW